MWTVLKYLFFFSVKPRVCLKQKISCRARCITKRITLKEAFEVLGTRSRLHKIYIQQNYHADPLEKLNCEFFLQIKCCQLVNEFVVINSALYLLLCYQKVEIYWNNSNSDRITNKNGIGEKDVLIKIKTFSTTEIVICFEILLND